MLKQSTAVTIQLGPFVDSADGFTPEVGLTIAQADIRISKNGGAFGPTNNVAGATHDENGWYTVPLDTTDTGTLGQLTLAVYASGARPVHREFLVTPSNTYDALVLGTDVLTADITQIGGVVQSATDLKDLVDTGYDPVTHKVQGVVLVDTNSDSNILLDTTVASVVDQSNFVLTAGSDINDAYNDQSIVLYDASNNNYPSIRSVSNYVGATKTITLSSAPDFTFVPGDGIKVYVTIPGTSAPTVAAIADAVWDEVLAGHTTADTPGLVVNMLTQDTVTLSTDVALDSIFGQLLDDGTAWSYDRTTDSLEAVETNFVTTLDRLSAARAGYLDNLSGGAVALASVCTDVRLAELAAANLPTDVDTLLSRLSLTRAGYLDNLSVGAVAQASVCTEARVARLDAAVSTRSSHTAANVWSVATRALTDKVSFSLAADQSAVTIGTVNTVGDKTGYTLSAAGIDAVWDEPMALHTTIDTPGWVLNMLTQDTVTLATDVALGSIFGQLLDDGTAWSYDRTTDSLEAVKGAVGVAQTGDVFAELPTNFSDLSIAVTSGLVDITQTAANKAWSTGTRILTAPTNLTSTNAAIVLHTDNKVLLAGTTHTSATVPTVTAVTNDVGITQAAADKTWGTAARILTAPTNLTSTNAAIVLHTDNKVLLAGTTHTSAVIPTVSTVTSVSNTVDINQAAADKVWGTAVRILTAPTNITSTDAAIELHTDNKVLLAGTTHTGADIPTIGIASSVSGAVGSVTGNLGGNVTGTIGSLSTQAKTDVNNQVIDVIRTDTIAEMAQGAPPVSPTLEEAVNYIYRKLRNKTATTGAEDAVYDDAGITKLFKSTLSDDGSTFTKAEYITGA